MSIVRFQQLILVIALLAWGQSLVRYALNGAFGNRFIGVATIVGISSFLLVLSYFVHGYWLARYYNQESELGLLTC